jgi:TRAP-type C4-dicarboxylate transport system permease small subunit
MYLLRLFDKIDKLIEYALRFMMAILVMVSLASVFCRFVISYPLFWADEFMRYIFIWVGMFASALLVIKKTHITVDFTDMVFPEKLRKIVRFICYVTVFVFMVFLCYFSLDLVKMGFSSLSPSMEINMGYVYLCMPISFALTAINAIRLIIKEFVLKEDTKGGDLQCY